MSPPIQYIPNFVEDPDQVFLALREELAWVRRDGTPRCEYYCNDFPSPYAYGRGRGVRLYEPQPYHPQIRRVRKKTEDLTCTVFEAAFLNRYLDQRDQLGWHSDDSPEMDGERPIAIISLGVEREIWFRPIQSESQPAPVTKLTLGHGSICIMKAQMQTNWQHRIPKASFLCGERISITFRGFLAQTT